MKYGDEFDMQIYFGSYLSHLPIHSLDRQTGLLGHVLRDRKIRRTVNISSTLLECLYVFSLPENLRGIEGKSETMTTNGHANEDKLSYQLMERMAGVVPIPGEEDFFVKPDTLRRFLKARNWDVDEAEKMLKNAVEWRRKNNVIHMDCSWCHDNPGHHSIRQVGFDVFGRPVIYSCFVQTTDLPTVEDTVAHCTYLIENAQRVMQKGVSTWVFILDCRGMSLPACNPKIGYGLTQVFANFYPERLGLVICLHHNPIFHGVWNAIKVFLHENTVAKMHLLRDKKKIQEECNRLFSPELRDWLNEEMKLNKNKPLPTSQRIFWKAPSNPKEHDPRGCPSYVAEYIDPFLARVKRDPENTHRPHPNIVDELKGTCRPFRSHLNKCDNNSCSAASQPSVDEDSESEESLCQQKLESIEISKEYQIPDDAVPLQS